MEAMVTAVSEIANIAVIFIYFLRVQFAFIKPKLDILEPLFAFLAA